VIIWRSVHSSLRMCRSLTGSQCNKKEMKEFFQICSKCKIFYYCSRQCQRTDWYEGGHRAACSAYGIHYLSMESDHTTKSQLNFIAYSGAYKDLTKFDRDFMRALLDCTYITHKGSIYDAIIKFIKTHPDTGYFIVFDYASDGPFSFMVHSLGEGSTVLDTLRKAGIEWEDTVARAARSEGRMTIHVMRVRDGNEKKYWVVPLRSTTGQISERLKRIAAEVPSLTDGQGVPDHFSNMDKMAYISWDIDAMH
jgi:hypothetical protein